MRRGREHERVKHRVSTFLTIIVLMMMMTTTTLQATANSVFFFQISIGLWSWWLVLLRLSVRTLKQTSFLRMVWGSFLIDNAERIVKPALPFQGDSWRQSVNHRACLPSWSSKPLKTTTTTILFTAKPNSQTGIHLFIPLWDELDTKRYKMLTDARLAKIHGDCPCMKNGTNHAPKHSLFTLHLHKG